MKAKFLSKIAIAAIAVLVSSCDMDLAPIGVLDQSNAIQSTNDARRFRNGFYTGMRALTASSFYSLAEIQADCFNGLTINGNRMGTFANGDVLSSDSDISSFWYSFFYYINNTNYFLSTVQPLYEAALEENRVEDAQQYELYISEAHFTRGFWYAVMFDRWCVQYKPELGDQPGMGLPIVKEYDPTFDRGKYPARATLNETISFIKEEIGLAYKGLMEYEEVAQRQIKPMDPYINHLVVAAMQARFALWTSDYDLAINKANEVINSGIYVLAGYNDKGAADEYYPNMWIDDNSKEIIFMPYESTQELGAAYGSAWLGAYLNQADYIPTSTVINNLMTGYNKLLKRYDIRFNSFIAVRDLTSSYGTISTPCFNKFPGNPALQTTTTNNLVNKPKPFRLSEMYLILAEAAYNKGDNTTANNALKAIWEKRYKGPAYAETSGSALREAIIMQRTIELLGEGFRLSDLRRWNMGFTRTADYAGTKMDNINKTGISQIITPPSLMVTYTTDDHRYTWPIPSDELEVNPQMADQQNPGY